MSKPQIICSQSIDVFCSLEDVKMFFLFHCNHDVFLTIIARNRNETVHQGSRDNKVNVV